jgi:hypothetical protein
LKMVVQCTSDDDVVVGDRRQLLWAIELVSMFVLIL